MLHRTLKTLAIVLLAPPLACVFAQEPSIDVIPRPAQVQQLDGARVSAKTPTTQLAHDESFSDEGYVIETSKSGVQIRANAPPGFFHARQTLAQLADAAETIPQLRITDRPRFGYRGLLLDSARHIQSIDYIKHLIDRMALYKLNRLHWHLTDDVGWRVPIDKRPKLTEIGAWRSAGKDRYGGFYTRDQLRDLVAYAAARFVTIIPEIEMPGHAQAAVASYPQIGCTGEPVPVLDRFILSEHPLCPSNEETYRFVDDVLDGVCDIFPSQTIHLGGDECPGGPWKNCPRCQAFIRDHHLADENGLQDYFSARVAALVQKHGRRMQGWGEIYHDGVKLPKDTIVQQWYHDDVGVAAARAGYDVVVSQLQYLYFDYAPERTPMERVYGYDPLPQGLEMRAARHILGPQGQLWTETCPTEKDCDAKLWPRTLALAEMAWTPRDRMDWRDFQRRADRARLP